MRIVLIRVQQTNRHRLRARLRDLPRQRIDLAFVQRMLDGAANSTRSCTPKHNSRGPAPPAERESDCKAPAVLPSDGNQIFKSVRGDEGRLHALAFQQRIRRHSRPVHHIRRFAAILRNPSSTTRAGAAAFERSLNDSSFPCHRARRNR